MHAPEAVGRSNEGFKDAPLARQILQDAPLIKQYFMKHLVPGTFC